METSLLLVSASIATILLVAVLFVAGALLRNWRQEMGGGGGRKRGEPKGGGGPSLEAIYAEFMAKQSAPDAQERRAEARAHQDQARAQVADADGLLARLRRDAAETAGELTPTILEAETELREIRACLNRGDVALALERAQSLTLRLAGEIARRGPSG